jgi:septin family protein
LQVNIIPVIAKADTLTPEECVRFKKTVRTERERERERETNQKQYVLLKHLIVF